MERFRLEVGHNHDVMPGNIVGAIANEAGLDAQHIGRINIHDDHSTVDLPDDMPDEIFKELKNVWVSGQTLKISRLTMDGKSSRSTRPSFEKPSKGPDKGLKKDKKPKRKPAAVFGSQDGDVRAEGSDAFEPLRRVETDRIERGWVAGLARGV